MTRNAALLFLLVATLSAPAAVRAQSSPPPAAAPDSAVLRPGDMLHIAVWQQPELSGEFQVAEDGSLVHPLYRTVQVAGVPIPEVEERIRDFLARYETDPTFVLVPRLQVWVGGEVRSPRLYQLRPGTTVGEAIAVAGGPLERADLERVRVIRDGDELFVDLRRPESAGGGATIRSGDQILVERRSSFFRDYVVPVASVTSGLATLVHLILRFTE